MAIPRTKMAGPLLASLLVPAVAAAQQNPFIGAWQCSYNTPAMGGNPSMTVYDYSVIDSNGRFRQTERLGELTMNAVGTYQILSDNIIRGTLEDYNPKQICAGQQGCVQIPRPDPMNARYHFMSPTSLTLYEAAAVNGQTLEVTESCTKVR